MSDNGKAPSGPRSGASSDLSDETLGLIYEAEMPAGLENELYQVPAMLGLAGVWPMIGSF